MDKTSTPSVTTAVRVFVGLTALPALIALAVAAGSGIAELRARPWEVVTFVVLSVALQLFAMEVPGGGRIGVAGIGLLAAGFALGPSSAVLVAFVAGIAQIARVRPPKHVVIFDVAQFCLSAGLASVVFHSVVASSDSVVVGLLAAVLAAAANTGLNHLLICLAIGLTERESPYAIWRERFRWARFHYLSFGPLAFVATLAYQKMGYLGLITFTVPPALVLVSVRQFLDRTRRAMADVQDANAALQARNEDLRALLELAQGLAARGHDREALAAYAGDALTALTGSKATISLDEKSEGLELNAAGERVGSVVFSDGEAAEGERWQRIRDVVLPQLATTLESASLVAELRRVHLEMITVLSRSMEAKDYYTGGHTERVAEISVAIAEHLGFEGEDLESVEVGALLHDIGKIGIPERVLHKDGPLDEDEWRIMREHPVISDTILAEVDLPAIVRQIVRSGHERIDGAGYPDALPGDKIPLPARIVLVADAFDALTTDRPYRVGRSSQAALEELRAHAGTQFCPVVLAAFESALRDSPERFVARALASAAA